MRSFFKMFAVLSILAFAATSFAGGKPPPCGTTQNYTLHVTDQSASNPPPSWDDWTGSGPYLPILTTANVYFAFDRYGPALSGTQSGTIFVNMPDGNAYTRYDFDFTGSTAYVTGTCTQTIWPATMPVAGTIIQSYNLYGLWTAYLYVNSVQVDSVQFYLQ